MQKTALIVDDSATARKVLQTMLEVHDLAVDNADSAESALEYLGDNRPDIIFMDHEMPGMDGFEAVSAIKKNPATATIPIMMYTAQEGELYVGQARALGAVGVLPKEVEPVELSKVLESLRVIGEDAERREHYAESEEGYASGEYPALEKFDQHLGVLIQELFDQQRSILRRDLRHSEEIIAARVADEIRAPGADEGGGRVPWFAKYSPGSWKVTAAALAVFSLLLGFLYWKAMLDNSTIRQENASLQLALQEQQSALSEDTFQTRRQLEDYREAINSTFGVALNALEWAANQSSIYGFDEVPLGDFRLSIMSELSSQLVALDFRGLVRIESHVGDFCMTVAEPGNLVPAGPALPASQCDQIGFESNEAYEYGMRQSVAFANFINLADDRTGGRIRYEVMSRGNADPLFAYPMTPEGISASTWNEIAASNHRVEVSLYPDTTD